jgi:hypothetical protein
MTSIQNNTLPIDIGFLDVSSQNRAVLSFFIESMGAEVFKEVGLDKASAFITDFDLPGAKESWMKHQSKTKKPTIILSVNELEILGNIWVKKPLTAQALTNAGQKINEIINEALAQPVNNNVPVLETSDSAPVLITESMPALEPALSAETINTPPVSIDLMDTLTLEVRPTDEVTTTKINVDSKESEMDELDTLLNDLNTESQPSEEGHNDTIIDENKDLILTSTEPQFEVGSIELPKDISSDNLSNPQENSNIGLIAERPEIGTETLQNQQELSQNIDLAEPELFNELIIESPSEGLQEIQPNEQSTSVDDTNITKNMDNNISTDSNVKPEESKNQNTSYAEATDGDLEAMLDELQQEMGDSTEGTANSNINSHSTDGSTQKTYQGTQAQERWALLCGDKNIVKSTSDIKKTAYILNEHLLSSLLVTVKEGKETQKIKRIKYEDLLIIIDYKTESIYSDLSIYSNEYAQICFDPINDKKIKIHSLDDSEIRMLHQKFKSDPNNVYSTEAFIWTTSLLTSRGRLLENTNTKKMIGLKSWPNLTRIESFPHMMNIAAVFSKNPGSLMDVSKWLNIPQCYVFAFYNAAFSLGMIDLDTDVVSKNNIKKISFNFGSKKKSENSGLFSRLLNKIKG